MDIVMYVIKDITKNEHSGSAEDKENVKQKKLMIRSGPIKLVS